MATYSVFAPNGELSRVLTIGEGDLSGNILDGETCIPGVYSLHYVHEGLVLPLPTQPSPHHTFDYATKQWTDPRSLQDFKDAQWEQVKLQRNNAEFSVFKFQEVYYDCDRISQSRIQGAAQLASIALANNQTVVQEWTTADNSVVSLNATDLLNLGLQLGLFVNKVHDYGRVLRARIDAADSSLDVQEVLWDEAEFNATLQ